jgi:GT2 family glycosyltransferase
MKKISVLIPTRNHPELLVRCLGRLAVAEKTSGCDLEIVVLDGASTDELAGHLGKRRGLKDVVWCPVEHWWNFSQIINYGVEHSAGEYLLFLNDDCYIPDDFFSPEVIEQSMAFADNGVCGFMLTYPDGRIQMAGYTQLAVNGGPPILVGHGMNPSWYTPPPVLEMHAVSFSCALTTKARFEEMEGLDGRFCFGMEDVDFCMRVRKEQGSVVVRNDVSCIHEGAASQETLLKNFPGSNNRNLARLWEKWGKDNKFAARRLKPVRSSTKRRAA